MFYPINCVRVIMSYTGRCQDTKTHIYIYSEVGVSSGFENNLAASLALYFAGTLF